MTIKSLTITEEAYNALKRQKHADESFSKTIIRISHKSSGDLRRFLGILKNSDRSSEEWLKEIKKERNKSDNEFDTRQRKYNDIK